ncbi:hypothetical protein A2U01_0118751, partial [Trifolium medium]|nr:hypothetical protein [Trifolium medium]
SSWSSCANHVEGEAHSRAELGMLKVRLSLACRRRSFCSRLTEHVEREAHG